MQNCEPRLIDQHIARLSETIGPRLAGSTEEAATEPRADPAAATPGHWVYRANCTEGRFYHHQPDDDRSKLDLTVIALMIDAHARVLSQPAEAERFRVAPRLPTTLRADVHGRSNGSQHQERRGRAVGRRGRPPGRGVQDRSRVDWSRNCCSVRVLPAQTTGALPGRRCHAPSTNSGPVQTPYGHHASWRRGEPRGGAKDGREARRASRGTSPQASVIATSIYQ